jgi:hypothetical protein
VPSVPLWFSGGIAQKAESTEGAQRRTRRGSIFVSFVVKSCLEPEPGAIWLRRFNHEEHEGTRRWLGSICVSFVVKIGFEPEPRVI